MIEWFQAILLGVVEGLTEFLPISSTGHLILVSHWLGLDGEAVKTFEVVIQGGAMMAVIGLYRSRLVSMGRALVGRDESGRRLVRNLFIGVLPAVIAGATLHRPIKGWLFHPWPVVAALAAGGILMVGLDGWLKRTSHGTARTLDSITLREAFVIGLAQCLALWPGTSRAMVTLMAGMALGLPPMVAAEYSFLLALPTIGSAVLFDVVHGGQVLWQEIGLTTISCGFASACLVAVLAIRGLLRYLTRHGLMLFGWYRIGLAGIVWWVAGRA